VRIAFRREVSKVGSTRVPDFMTQVDSSIWARVGSGQATRWQSRVGSGPPCFRAQGRTRLRSLLGTGKISLICPSVLVHRWHLLVLNSSASEWCPQAACTSVHGDNSASVHFLSQREKHACSHESRTTLESSGKWHLREVMLLSLTCKVLLHCCVVYSAVQGTSAFTDLKLMGLVRYPSMPTCRHLASSLRSQVTGQEGGTSRHFSHYCTTIPVQYSTALLRPEHCSVSTVQGKHAASPRQRVGRESADEGVPPRLDLRCSDRPRRSVPRPSLASAGVQPHTSRYTEGVRTVQHSTAQYSTAQHSTVQYSPMQYSKIQYSTVAVRYRTVPYLAVHENDVKQRAPFLPFRLPGTIAD